METRLGRNDPCHCGSGRKYKKCCLEKDAETPAVAKRGTAGLSRAQENELILAFKTRHYAEWPDVSLPALDGKTPRAAMKTASGKKRVAALVDSIEDGESTLNEAQRYDVGILRAQLGLASGPAELTVDAEIPIETAAPAFEGVYLFRLGPVTFGKGKPAQAWTLVMTDGRIGAMFLELSDAVGMKKIAKGIPAGVARACSPELATLGAKHGFVPLAAPRTALEAMTSVSTFLAGGQRAQYRWELVEALGRLSRDLLLSKPWRHWDSDTCLEAVVTANDKQTRVDVSVLGELGEVFGFALYPAGDHARFLEEPRAKAPKKCIALWLEEDPPFFAEAFRRAWGIGAAPRAIELDHGDVDAAEPNDVARLVAVGRALTKLSPASPIGRAEVVVDGVRVSAEVRAPALSS